MNQNYKTNTFDKNSLYAFSVVVETTHKNIDTYPKVILINLDNFNKFNTEEPILTFQIQDKKGNVETEMYESIHIILDNIKEKDYTINKEIKKFAHFLKSRDLEQIESAYKGDEKIMAAVRTVEDLSTDPEFIGYYDVEEARKQDLLDAKLTGKEEGIQEGIEQANFETAKNLLSMNVLSIEQISEATKLSIEQIKKLKEEL